VGHWPDGVAYEVDHVEVTFNEPIDPATFTAEDVTVGLAELQEIGSFLAAKPNDVQIVGTLAYVADYDVGLRVLDVSNPAIPVEVGLCGTPGHARAVDVIGPLAYVADSGDGGLRIIDVSNPAAPVELGFYDTPGSADVVGSLAYVADNEDLRIIDVSNPAAPVEVGSYDPSYAEAVEVVGSLAYVATYRSGLWILDVSNPASPSKVGSYYPPGYALGVDIVGSLA